MGTVEQRQHARIETSLECTVVAGEHDFTAEVTNLSRSGAGLIGPEGKTERDASLMLLLERSEGGFSLAIPARVLRVGQREGQTLYGVHFEAVPPEVDEELVRLLKTLAEGRGQGKRLSPRVAARVRVRCKSKDSFVATLNDLSCGGLSVRCPRPVEEGRSLTVQFGVEEHPALVSVSGEVLRVSLQDDGGFLVSLKFDPPTLDDRARVLSLLQVLLELGPRQGVLEDDDDT